MKKLILVSLFLFSAAGSAFAESSFTYDCGGMKVILWRNAKDQQCANLTWTTDEGRDQSGKVVDPARKISITSKSGAKPENEANDEVLKATHLNNTAILYDGFVYRNGEKYIAEEGDTNERWFAFGIEPAALFGQANVKAGDYLYSDFDSPEVNRYNCKRVR